MAEHTVVILGGGTGGLVAARRLRAQRRPRPRRTARLADAAHNLYTLDGAAAGDALRRFAGGRVAVAVSSLP